MKQPLVSAIVSAYNSERFLRGCLEDLEAQTIADRLEIVVIDSASPQNERAIVEEFRAKHDNIVYLRTPSRESTHAAFSRAARVARGKYLTLACTDDRHKADALERMAAVLDSRPDIALVYGNCYITEGENETFDRHTGRKVYRWIDWDPLQLLSGCFIGPQPMWRRALHDKYGWFDGALESAGDWEFWLRLAEGETFLHIDEMLGLYLWSETSSEHRNPERHRRELEQVHARYVHREPRLQALKSRRENRVPAASGVAVLVVRNDEPAEQIESAVARAREARAAGHEVIVHVVRAAENVPDNTLGVKVSPPTPTAARALNEAAAWEARYVVLLSPDVVLSKNWLRDLARLADANGAVAAVGPVSNAAPEPQILDGAYNNLGKAFREFTARLAREKRDRWADVPHLGGFCLLLRSDALRATGGLPEDQPLPMALLSFFRRAKAAGLRLACARGVYVHHEALTDLEGAGYDALAAVRSSLDATLAEGESALERGDFAAAVDQFGRVVADLPQYAPGRVALGVALHGLGRHEDAAEELGRAAQLEPGSAEIHNRLGVVLFAAGKMLEAESALTKALELDPDFKDARLNLIALYRESGALAKAADALRMAARRHPADPDVLSELARLSLVMGGAAGGQAALDHIRSVAPDHPAVASLRECLAGAH